MCGYWIVVSGLVFNLRLVRCALCVYWCAGVACVAAVVCARLEHDDHRVREQAVVALTQVADKGQGSLLV